MASNLYNKGVLKLLDGTIDYLTDNIAILLVNNTYTFDRTHEFVSNISGEVSGTGYARKVVPSKTVSLNTATNTVIFDCGTIEYTAVDVSDTLSSAIVYADGSTDADRALIANIEFGDLATSNADINIVTSDDGLFKVTNTIS